MRKYLLTKSNQLLRRVYPSLKAPTTQQESMQLGANQNTGRSLPHQPTDYSQAGPVLQFAQKLRSKRVVKMVQVEQRGYLLLAPHPMVAADRSATMLAYPEQAARSSYDWRQLQAPPVYQSVPGYTVKAIRRNNSNPYYPRKALRAPGTQQGGGACG